MRVTKDYVFFWHGEFSNWYRTEFISAGVKFTSTEQAMMVSKALLFDDKWVADMIMRTNNPQEQKHLGRKVRNFDADKWNSVALHIVTELCYQKFTQNDELKTLMLSHGNREFVEASPLDKIWGIGLHYDDDEVLDRNKWKGTNWLGIALTKARDRIIEEQNGI